MAFSVTGTFVDSKIATEGPLWALPQIGGGGDRDPTLGLNFGRQRFSLTKKTFLNSAVTKHVARAFIVCTRNGFSPHKRVFMKGSCSITKLCELFSKASKSVIFTGASFVECENPAVRQKCVVWKQSVDGCCLQAFKAPKFVWFCISKGAIGNVCKCDSFEAGASLCELLLITQ